MAGLPPLPAETVTVAEALPATAVGVPGIPGGPGMTADDADEAPEVPLPFVAVDVNVYEVPFVRPVTVQLVAGDVTVQVNAPGDDVTVKEVGEPVPAVTVTVAWAVSGPATAVGVPGVPGGGPGATYVKRPTPVPVVVSQFLSVTSAAPRLPAGVVHVATVAEVRLRGVQLAPPTVM